MASRGRPRRGRLPERVYWVRRTMVLLAATALVLGLARLVGGLGSDGAPDQASTAGASTQQSPAATGPALGPSALSKPVHMKATGPLLAPTGPCDDRGVSAIPMVSRVYPGRPVALRIRLEGTQPSCTFQVSPETLAVKITSGTERFWSTQDCPKAIRPDSVVVRSGVPTYVQVTWSGRRSDESCTGGLDWALPGFYDVYAAAMGSATANVRFEVVHARRAIITRTAHPHPTTTTSPSARPTRTPRPTPTPTGKTGGGSVCGGDNAAGTC